MDTHVGSEVSMTGCFGLTGAVQSKMESEASVGSEVKSNAESKSCASVGTEVSKHKHDMVCIEARHDVGRWNKCRHWQGKRRLQTGSGIRG